MTEVLETVSKKKQGRPKGYASLSLLSLENDGLRGLLPEGGHRTLVNHIFMQDVLQLIIGADESVQRTVWGCVKSEIASGTANFPRGWKTFAPEIGRYLSIADDDEKQNALNVIVDARQRGLSWSDIGAHFRTCRLGEREGNPGALSLAINRAINDFKKRFPKTSEDDIFECLQHVLNHRNEAGADRT